MRLQSSFELTGYITTVVSGALLVSLIVSKLFRAYRLYNDILVTRTKGHTVFQSSFELTGYITSIRGEVPEGYFKQFQSSFEPTCYITHRCSNAYWRCNNSFKALSSLQVI